MKLPKTGATHEAVLARMRQMRAEDANWKDGRTFSLVYHAGDDVSALVKAAYSEFIAENGLSPMAFPSLRRFEAEVLRICADLFHGDAEVCGTMTSGGSESVLMAVKTAREWAKAKGITKPEMICPTTIHPAFEKAGHYFDVKVMHAPLTPDFRVDVAAVEKLITPQTILIVGSAMPYPHGVVDPIAELAALASRRGLLCHVDACLGGFFLPFARKLGREIPKFDFEVPGVTSLSADLHKYGYAAKGASVVLYKTHALRKHQFFTYSEWPGGLYLSPSMTGTRPGGAIAAAWAILHYLGEEGYLTKVKQILETTQRLMEGIGAISGMKILGKPHGSVFAWASDTVDVYQLGDAMEAKGWKLDRQQKPPALHCMVTPAHAPIVEVFLTDLRACVASLKSGEPAPEGSAALYGMVGTVPKETADGFLLDFLDGLYEA
jgi:sphinganine-1-phosphate aldolase